MFDGLIQLSVHFNIKSLIGSIVVKTFFTVFIYYFKSHPFAKRSHVIVLTVNSAHFQTRLFACKLFVLAFPTANNNKNAIYKIVKFKWLNIDSINKYIYRIAPSKMINAFCQHFRIYMLKANALLCLFTQIIYVLFFSAKSLKRQE